MVTSPKIVMSNKIASKAPDDLQTWPLLPAPGPCRSGHPGGMEQAASSSTPPQAFCWHPPAP